MRFFYTLLALFTVLPAMASSPSDLRVLGENAPVQLYLFTSLTCPHCADFHKKVLPAIKKEYVDKKQATITIVDMVTNENSLIAAQSIRCVDSEVVPNLEKTLYSNQSKWMQQKKEEARKTISSYALKQKKQQGNFNTCMADTALQKTIIEQQANLARLYGITGTPTLVMRKGNEVYKWAGGNKKEVMESLKEAFSK